MQDKVWVINDPSERGRPVRTARTQGGGRPGTTRRPVPAGKERNPAIAFSLSVFFWGGGQLYNRQWNSGPLLILVMINFHAFLGIGVFFWRDIARAFSMINITSSQALLISGLMYVCGLLIWFAGMVQAYYRTNRTRQRAFEGVEKAYLPPLASFFFPGWGQFLNGQPRKGTFYLALALAGFVAFPSLFVIPSLWRYLEPSTARNIIEWILVVSAGSVPFILLLWLVCFYDALRIGVDEVKRENWWRRMIYARNRIRMQGLGSVLPQLKITFLFSLLLAIFLIVGYYFFPKEYYADRIERIHAVTMKRNMVVIPKLLERVLKSAPAVKTNSPIS